MPDTKNFSLRVSTLDGLLKKKEGISMKEMMKEVNDRLDRRGATHVKSKNTILRDLDEIRNRFCTKIICFRDQEDERIVRYRYEDIDFSIRHLLPMLLEHRCQLGLIFRFCAICLGPFFIEWAEELLDLLDLSIVHSDMDAKNLGNDIRTLLANTFIGIMEDDESHPIDLDKRKIILDLKKLFIKIKSFT